MAGSPLLFTFGVKCTKRCAPIFETVFASAACQPQGAGSLEAALALRKMPMRPILERCIVQMNGWVMSQSYLVFVKKTNIVVANKIK